MTEHTDLSLLHGGEIEWAVSEKYGIPISKITSFASTVSPIIPDTIKTLSNRFAELYLYPARDHHKLKEILSERHEIKDARQIILGSGSTEIIHLLAQYLQGAEAIIPVPTYSEYETAVQRYGGKPVLVAPKSDFSIDVEAVGRSVSPRTGAIYVCNPNNPTGKLYERDQMESLAELAQKNKLLLFVDEAYLCFCPPQRRYSMVPQIDSYPIFVLNSLSKHFGIPSIRLGWGIGSRDVVSRLEELKIPWILSSLAVWAAEALLVDHEYQEMILNLITSQRSELEAQLATVPWLQALKSDTNFLLLRIIDRGLTSSHVFEYMARTGQILRDCSSMRGLGNRYLRATVRKPADNRRLVDSLRELAVERQPSTVESVKVH